MRAAGPAPAEVKAQRSALDMTQMELAVALGVAVSTVARWEMEHDRGQPAPRMAGLALRQLVHEHRGCCKTAS